MARKQRPMIQKGNRVFIFKNTKAIVDANDFAEGAAFIKYLTWRAHG
jgi:hypothetical protein